MAAYEEYFGMKIWFCHSIQKFQESILTNSMIKDDSWVFEEHDNGTYTPYIVDRSLDPPFRQFISPFGNSVPDYTEDDLELMRRNLISSLHLIRTSEFNSKQHFLRE